MNKFDIDSYQGINRAERTQSAIAHLLNDINNKLDKLIQLENVSRETISNVKQNVSRETIEEDVKQNVSRETKSKKAPKKKEVK